MQLSLDANRGLNPESWIAVANLKLLEVRQTAVYLSVNEDLDDEADAKVAEQDNFPNTKIN